MMLCYNMLSAYRHKLRMIKLEAGRVVVGPTRCIGVPQGSPPIIHASPHAARVPLYAALTSIQQSLLESTLGNMQSPTFLAGCNHCAVQIYPHLHLRMRHPVVQTACFTWEACSPTIITCVCMCSCYMDVTPTHNASLRMCPSVVFQ